MLDAPTGQVTLVFTDVQGSTVLWDHAPDGMREALALHDAIMRETLGAAEGYEVKTEGDALWSPSPRRPPRWAGVCRFKSG